MKQGLMKNEYFKVYIYIYIGNIRVRSRCVEAQIVLSDVIDFQARSVLCVDSDHMGVVYLCD